MMGVASHLNIRLDEYDARIRTFVPDYETQVNVTAEALHLLDTHRPTIIDLGIGTGALTARCLEIHPGARIIGIDADEGMLASARERLLRHSQLELVHGDFLQLPFPACDGIVATLALHHVPSPGEKKAFYGKCRAALRSPGLLVTADCYPAREARLAAIHREAWLAHLQRSYSPEEAQGYLDTWADEDYHFPLDEELRWLGDAGFSTEILWRRHGFAVVAAMA
jgi:tRNA (cmo5U34)-methyltransferase